MVKLPKRISILSTDQYAGREIIFCVLQSILKLLAHEGGRSFKYDNQTEWSKEYCSKYSSTITDTTHIPFQTLNTHIRSLTTHTTQSNNHITHSTHTTHRTITHHKYSTCVTRSTHIAQGAHVTHITHISHIIQRDHLTPHTHNQVHIELMGGVEVSKQ